MTALIGTPVAVRAGCSGFQETRSSAADLTTLQNPASGLRLSSSGGPFCNEANSGARSGWSVPTASCERLSTRRRETPCLSVTYWRCATNPRELPGAAEAGEDPAWVQDYALFLFDADGRVAGWYSGAERIYGYRSEEIVGQPVSCLYPGEDLLGVKLKEELKRAAAQGHFGSEGWHIRKDGSRFWANVLTDGPPKRKRGTAGLCESGARFQQASRRRKRSCSAAACSGS